MSQWIKSGVVNQVVFFSAPPGLSNWVVYGAKGSAAAAAFTTPTVSAIDATNMAGRYKLALDEQTTVTAGQSTEILTLRITADGWSGTDIDVVLFDNLPADMNQFLGDDLTVAGTGGQLHGV